MAMADSILVVSPDATTLRGLTRALAGSGLPVTSALGWSEGELRLRHLPVSVMVTDLEELGAAEIVWLRRLRSEFPHVEVIALVSLPTPEVLAATAQGLVLSVFEKPIALARLEESVKLALARRPVP
ncbi:MAG: hypothetical protein HY728_09670 [Candidatus Rokubacteria bacterium]|nr:hypothetical protein [Candidatus Rokubacteria bacterium]